MLKEIYETPEVLARTVNLLQLEYLRDATLMISKARNVIITRSGTSYAALIGRHYLRTLAGVNANTIPAGEFLYEGLDLVELVTLIIAVSQSGESTDKIKVVRMARRRALQYLA